MSTNTRTPVTAKEAGMVSIMVTMILMIVISLIVVGFAQISRRNQREALDRQLSTQAFYAAETGVNDAADLIKTRTEGGQAITAKPNCASTGGGVYAGLSGAIDNPGGVAYTCLMVDPAPRTLLYSSVGTTSIVVPLNAASGTIANLNLIWNSKNDSTTPMTGCPGSATNVFSTTGNWNCGYGVLRVDLVPTTGGLSHAGLQTSLMTSFLVPTTGGTNGITYGPGSGNNRVAVRCTNTNCNLSINGLSQSSYYARISSLYRDVSLQISATNGGGTPVNLTGAQAVIDSTGKAQDVLRRIRVNVPLTASSRNLLSDYAIQSTDAICKRYVVMDGYFQSYAAAAVPGLGPTTTNPLCQ
jgi:Tfp pilus assembly protein PilX